MCLKEHQASSYGTSAWEATHKSKDGPQDPSNIGKQIGYQDRLDNEKKSLELIHWYILSTQMRA